MATLPWAQLPIFANLTGTGVSLIFIFLIVGILASSSHCSSFSENCLMVSILVTDTPGRLPVTAWVSMTVCLRTPHPDFYLSGRTHHLENRWPLLAQMFKVGTRARPHVTSSTLWTSSLRAPCHSILV